MAKSKFRDRDGDATGPAGSWDDEVGSGPQNKNPILGIDDLGRSMRGSGTLTGVITPYSSTFGNGYFFEIVVDGKTYDLRVKGVGKNYDAMRRIVPNTKKAKGTIVQLQVLTFNDNDYVAIVG